MRAKVVADWKTLENVEVECTHCGIRMTAQPGIYSKEKYFRCSSCRRWISSTYSDVLKADAKVRTYPVKEAATQDQTFEGVKDRLERWLAQIEDQDPYRLLGVSPLDSPDAIRARFRELALERHPDRGGSAEGMRELNAAYERILRHRQNKRAERLAAGANGQPSALPHGKGERQTPG